MIPTDQEFGVSVALVMLSFIIAGVCLELLFLIPNYFYLRRVSGILEPAPEALAMGRQSPPVWLEMVPIYGLYHRFRNNSLVHEWFLEQKRRNPQVSVPRIWDDQWIWALCRVAEFICAGICARLLLSKNYIPDESPWATVFAVSFCIFIFLLFIDVSRWWECWRKIPLRGAELSAFQASQVSTRREKAKRPWRRRPSTWVTSAFCVAWVLLIVYLCVTSNTLVLGGLPVPDQNGRVGFVQGGGEWSIDPQFEDAQIFTLAYEEHYGRSGVTFYYYAAAEKDGLWGYLDEGGGWVIEPKYADARSFDYDKAWVRLPDSAPEGAGKWGLIDHKGDFLIEPQFDAACNFDNGLAAVVKDGRCGFINESGNVVIPLKFDNVAPFRDNYGITQAAVGGKWGYIDSVGEWLIQPKFPSTAKPGTIVEDRASGYGAGWFREGLAPVYLKGSFSSGGICAYIDTDGKQAFSRTFEAGGEFSNGLAPVRVDGKWGFIDSTGSMVIEPQFESFGSDDIYLSREQVFNEGLLAVAREGKVGYINEAGAFVIEPQFDDATSFSEGFAYTWTRIGESVTLAVIDKRGKQVYTVTLPEQQKPEIGR